MSNESYRNTQLSIERRAADLLGRMTLEEKAAQVLSANGEDARLDEQGQLAGAEYRQALRDGMGILHRPTVKLPPAEGARVTNAIQRYLVEETRLGIPALLHEEALHGLMAYGATSFPQAIGLGSTWDPALVERVFAAAGLEMRSRGSNLALTPVLDLAREPRWGRTEECFGEDPYLVSQIGAAAVRGLQGRAVPIGSEHVLATAKHYTAHGQPEGGRNVAPVNVSTRLLREEFLPPFQAAVQEAGVGAVMASYNEIDGLPSHINPWLLRDVLRGEWGFDGLVISDGDGVGHLYQAHAVAVDPADAARQALRAGVNIEIANRPCYATVRDSVRAGLLPEHVLDEAVLQVLKAKLRLGLFEQPYVDPERAQRVNNAPEHQQLALQAARQALVLLKNEGDVLPLDRGQVRRLALIGPNATGLHLGGYSQDPGRGVTLLEGVRALAGPGIEVLHAEGCRITENARGWGDWWTDDTPLADPQLDEARIKEALELAATADTVVLVLGDNEATCREAWSEPHLGDRASLDLIGRQGKLAQQVLQVCAENGTLVVLALVGGRPVSLGELAQRIPAVLECWYLGQEGGTAFAEVLFGDTNPSGRLPITFPRSAGHLPAYYYHKPTRDRSYVDADSSVLFPFGHGLSYTQFRYGGLRLSASRIKADESLEVEIDVTNTGKRPGAEVVQLYVHDRHASVTRPVRLLKGFHRLQLEPGETQTAAFHLPASALALWDARMQRVVEPGWFDLWVGPDSQTGGQGEFEVV